MPDGHDHIHQLWQKSSFFLMMTTPVQGQAQRQLIQSYPISQGRSPLSIDAIRPTNSSLAGR
jgi:hypothetical protein